MLFFHRSITSTTELEKVDLTDYRDVTVSLLMKVANTIYYDSDSIHAYLTNDVETVDVINLVAQIPASSSR